MKRVLAVAALALALAGAVTAAPAHAYRGGPSSPITDPANKEAVRSLLRTITTNPAATGTGTAVEVETGLTRARQAAAILPKFRTIGTLGLATGAFTLGWSIGGLVYKKLVAPQLGSSAESGGSGHFPLRWKFYSSSVCSTLYTGCDVAADQWRLETSGNAYEMDWTGPSYSPGDSTVPLAAKTIYDSGAGTARVRTDIGSPPGAFVITLTEPQMSATLTSQTSDATEYGTLNSAGKGKFTAWSVPSTTSDAELTAALTELGANDSTDRSTSDPAAEHAIDAINHTLDEDYSADTITVPSEDCVGALVALCIAELDAAGHTGTRTINVADFDGADITKPAGAVITISPSGAVAPSAPLTITINPDAEEMPFALPRPQPNETYDDYIARLVALGYMGVVTPTVLTEETGDPATGPEAVPRLTTKIGTATGTTTLYRAAWPTPDPKIKAGADINAAKNPATFPEVTEDGGIPGTDVGAGGDCPCPIGALDFSPLLGISGGDKFPFGIASWIGDQLDDLVSAPERAPHVAVTIPAFTSGPFETEAWSFGWDFADTSAFNGYISIVRAALAFLLWLAGLWFLATRLLGIRGAPDPRDD